jgi:prepilin-type N-terminal cleavage/methylation domain-containing protein
MWKGFTLFEMLIAMILATLLMGGVLMMSAAIARDQKRLSARNETNTEGVVELLRFDLANARSMSQSSDGLTLVLVGHGGLDRRALAANNRLVRVTYRIDPERGALARQQEYLDDPVRPHRWSELVVTNVARLDVIATSNDSELVTEPAMSASMLGAQRIGDVRVAPQSVESSTVPTRVRIHFASSSSPIDREIWVR